MKLKDAFFKYLDKDIHRLEEIYSWNFPTKNLPFEYSKNGKSDYEESIDLRNFLNEKIRRGNYVAESQIWYVKDWGGVKGNKQSTLLSYVDMTNEELLSLGIKGISTWSKMLCIRNPEEYAIYDTRVAFTLNGLQRLYEVSDPYLFPLLSSRNTNISPLHKKIKNGIQSVEMYLFSMAISDNKNLSIHWQ